MPFEWIVALRFLREGRFQTVADPLRRRRRRRRHRLPVGAHHRAAGRPHRADARHPGARRRPRRRTRAAAGPLRARAGEAVVVAPSVRAAARSGCARSSAGSRRSSCASTASPRSGPPPRPWPARPSRAGARRNRRSPLRGVEPESFMRIIDVSARMTAGALPRRRAPRRSSASSWPRTSGVAVGDKVRLVDGRRARRGLHRRRHLRPRQQGPEPALGARLAARRRRRCSTWPAASRRIELKVARPLRRRGGRAARSPPAPGSRPTAG